jgi:hypothetical protein
VAWLRRIFVERVRFRTYHVGLEWVSSHFPFALALFGSSDLADKS